MVKGETLQLLLHLELLLHLKVKVQHRLPFLLPVQFLFAVMKEETLQLLLHLEVKMKHRCQYLLPVKEMDQ